MTTLPGEARRALPLALLAHAAATLLHHVHNAEFLADYPNMPAWLSRAGVYAAWAVMTAIGAAGWWLARGTRRLAGLALVALYGAYGVYSLGHYTLAPPSAHGAAMNATIALEAATGLALLAVVAKLWLEQLNASPRVARGALGVVLLLYVVPFGWISLVTTPAYVAFPFLSVFVAPMAVAALGLALLLSARTARTVAWLAAAVLGLWLAENVVSVFWRLVSWERWQGAQFGAALAGAMEQCASRSPYWLAVFFPLAAAAVYLYASRRR